MRRRPLVHTWENRARSGPSRHPRATREPSRLFRNGRATERGHDLGTHNRVRFGELPGMSGRLGLPTGIRACLFDLDGVLTQTARLHASAWKETFDSFLRRRADGTGEAFEPFDPVDYAEYVDGKLRYDGVRSFLSSRGIHLPEGDPSDPSDAATICGVGNRKNELVLTLMRRHGVETSGAPCATYAPLARPASAGPWFPRARTATTSRGGRHRRFFREVVDGSVAERRSSAGSPRLTHFSPRPRHSASSGRGRGVRGRAGRVSRRAEQAVSVSSSA